MRYQILCSVVAVVVAVQTTRFPIHPRSALDPQAYQHQRLTLAEGGFLYSMRHLRKWRVVVERLTLTSQKDSEHHRFDSQVAGRVVVAGSARGSQRKIA